MGDQPIRTRSTDATAPSWAITCSATRWCASQPTTMAWRGSRSPSTALRRPLPASSRGRAPTPLSPS